METTVDFSRIKHMHAVDRKNVRQVVPTEWAANGLKVSASGKWQQYWITHTTWLTGTVVKPD